MKKEVEDWLVFAERDIATAELIVEEEHLTGIAAFHCQQAIEKCFKAFLINNGYPLEKTHDLLKLYAQIRKQVELELDEDVLAIIGRVYLKSRYPGDIGLLPDGLPSVELAQVFLEFAKEVNVVITKLLI